nr:hypothetical protein Itr_chr09CG14310 [Ipomoea trifida]
MEIYRNWREKGMCKCVVRMASEKEKRQCGAVVCAAAKNRDSGGESCGLGRRRWVGVATEVEIGGGVWWRTTDFGCWLNGERRQRRVSGFWDFGFWFSN